MAPRSLLLAPALISLASLFFACSNTPGSADDHSDDRAPGQTNGGGGGTSSSGGGPSLNCNVKAPTECAEPRPTYEDVASIFESRCVLCHSGQTEHWPLTTYAHVATWRDEVRAAMLQCSMPPSDSGVPMDDSERDRILMWIRCGMPR